MRTLILSYNSIIILNWPKTTQNKLILFHQGLLASSVINLNYEYPWANLFHSSQLNKTKKVPTTMPGTNLTFTVRIWH